MPATGPLQCFRSWQRGKLFFTVHLGPHRGFPGGRVVKNLPAMQEVWVCSPGWDDPLEREMAAHPISLPGESRGQRSLAGHSPQSRKRVERN